MKSLSRVRLLATPWTAAYQAPPSMGFSRREYWRGVPLPSPQDQLNEEEIGYLSEKEFKMMGIKKFQNIKNRMEKMWEIFNTLNKDLEQIKNKQTVMNNTLTEIKNALKGIGAD